MRNYLLVFLILIFAAGGALASIPADPNSDDIETIQTVNSDTELDNTQTALAGGPVLVSDDLSVGVRSGTTYAEAATLQPMIELEQRVWKNYEVGWRA